MLGVAALISGEIHPVTPDQARLWRFLVAGVLNTAMGLLIYALALFLGAADWLALLVSLVIGIGFNFLTMGGYAFRQLTWSRLPRFVLAYLSVYLLNLWLLRLLNGWIQHQFWTQAALTPFIAAISFLLLSRWVFVSNKLKASHSS